MNTFHLNHIENIKFISTTYHPHMKAYYVRFSFQLTHCLDHHEMYFMINSETTSTMIFVDSSFCTCCKTSLLQSNITECLKTFKLDMVKKDKLRILTESGLNVKKLLEKYKVSN